MQQEAIMETDQMSADDTNSVDGEGVWSPDIEQCFQEALAMYPPCGRRKHILQEEGGGKMYGRNELISRYIFLQTGKHRTRKQVSSHIQVLARRKAKTDTTSGGSDGGTPSPSSELSNRSITMSTTPSQNGHRMMAIALRRDQQQQQQQQQQQIDADMTHSTVTNGNNNNNNNNHYYDIWMDRPIVTQKMRLVEFSAFIEYRENGNLLAPQSNNGQSSASMALAAAAASALDNPPIAGIHQHHPHHPHHPHHHLATNLHQHTALPASLTSATHPLASNHFHQAYNNLSVGHHNPHHYAPQPNQLHQHPTNGSPFMSSQQASINGLHENRPSSNDLHHLLRQPTAEAAAMAVAAANAQGAQLKRHSYVKIDYTQPFYRQTNKLEHIDINQIQDKFPEIGGPKGLFQRAPDSFFLVKFWADINNDQLEYNMNDQNSYFGFSSHFETIDSYKDITCSTKACSYGLQVVEKVDKIYATYNSTNGRYSYNINRSPMCEFMIQFIKKLRHLPEVAQMNSVLENFTILQVITSDSTSEILLCLAFVFEVAVVPSTHLSSSSSSSSSLDSQPAHNGPQYHVYKLTKD